MRRWPPRNDYRSRIYGRTWPHERYPPEPFEAFPTDDQVYLILLAHAEEHDRKSAAYADLAEREDALARAAKSHVKVSQVDPIATRDPAFHPFRASRAADG